MRKRCRYAGKLRVIFEDLFLNLFICTAGLNRGLLRAILE